MKLVLYYDLENAIKNAKDDFGLFKIVRNNAGTYAKIFPFFASLDYLIERDLNHVLPTLGLQYAFLVGTEMVAHKATGQDPYYNKAVHDLKKLVSLLEDYHISTDVSSLMEGEVYERKTRMEWNEKKLPGFLEEKYILVPTYGFHGNRQNTSFLQEHEVGSEEYILSLGPPSKVYQLTYSKAQGGLL